MGLWLLYGILYRIMALIWGSLWDYGSYMGFFMGLQLLYGIIALIWDSL